MRIFRTCFIFSLFFFSGLAQADSIYKWVDEQGVTHYSSGTPKDTQAQQIKVQPPSATTESAGTQSSTREWEATESMRNSKLRRDKQEQAENRLKAEKARRCTIARQRLNILQEERPVFSRNEKGEREYWDDKTRAEEIQQAKDAVASNC